MSLLIDGYNLLHATGIVGRRGGLQASREALLRFLAAAVEPAERPRTTVVFDAVEAPPGLPRTVSFEHMTVRYASDYPDADALLEELIAANHVPRQLLVVSSDHRVQRAAQRRRARFVDSDVWFAEAVRRRRRIAAPAKPTVIRPSGKLSADETAYWLAEFDADVSSPAAERSQKSPHAGSAEDIVNPFPPGYAEDLFDPPV